MLFEPHNRHLWVKLIEKEKDFIKPVFIMPDDYQPPVSPYATCEILAMSSDCSISLDIGDKIIVDRTTLQEIKADSETIYLVQENYVYGRIKDETDNW